MFSRGKFAPNLSEPPQFADFTYVSIDCDGFKELKISGLLDFPRNVIVPIDGVTGVVEPDLNKRVKGEINTTIYDINDLRFDVTLPAFALASPHPTGVLWYKEQYLISVPVLIRQAQYFQRNTPPIIGCN